MILGSWVWIQPPGTFPNVHFEYVFLDLAKVWSGCRLCSLVVWNPDSSQIAALNLVLKSFNTRQNQKTTSSVKLTRIPWMFNKIFYFFKKYKWSPLFNLKKSFDPPLLILDKVLDPPNFQEPSPPPGKNDTSLKALFWTRLRRRGYSPNFLQPIFESVSYNNRALIFNTKDEKLTFRKHIKLSTVWSIIIFWRLEVSL